MLLETVAGPVRAYLQGRKDTVRCIVASLTDENSGDLYEELRRQVRRPRDVVSYPLSMGSTPLPSRLSVSVILQHQKYGF